MDKEPNQGSVVWSDTRHWEHPCDKDPQGDSRDGTSRARVMWVDRNNYSGWVYAYLGGETSIDFCPWCGWVLPVKPSCTCGADEALADPNFMESWSNRTHVLKESGKPISILVKLKVIEVRHSEACTKRDIVGEKRSHRIGQDAVKGS